MSGILLFGSFAVLLVLGVPICVSLGLSSVVGLLASGFDLGMLPDTIYASVCKYALLGGALLCPGRRHHGVCRHF